MDLMTTYKIFLTKTLKEKKYYWARNTFFVLFPLLFIITYSFSGAANDARSIEVNPQQKSNAFPTIPQVSENPSVVAYVSIQT